jgi:hypothetical protein
MTIMQRLAVLTVLAASLAAMSAGTLSVAARGLF